MHNTLFVEKLPELCLLYDKHKLVFFGGEEKTSDALPAEITNPLEESFKDIAKAQARQTGEEFLKGRCGKEVIPLGLLASESKVLFGLIDIHGIEDWEALHLLFPQEGKGIYTRGKKDLKDHYEIVMMHMANKKDREELSHVCILCFNTSGACL